MAETQQQVKKTKMSPVLMVGIGCVVFVVFLSIVFSVIGGFLAKKVGTSMIQSAIESKTGVKANLQDIENGKMTFTDSKTGQTVDVGTGKLPDTFPKDFPVYSGAKVGSAIAGGGVDEGYIVSFSTKDSADKVTSFYKDSLKKNDWTIDSTNEYGPLTTFVINKGTLEGSVSISQAEASQETVIAVTLGEKKN